MRFSAVLVGALVLIACNETPTTPSVLTGEEIRQQLLTTNLDHPTNGGRGRLVRWRVPIAVNTNGIERAELAIQRYEEWSGGVIRFTRVSGVPVNGILVVEGGAKDADNTPGCVHVTDQPADADSNSLVISVDGSGAIIGSYTVHLGGTDCNDEKEGRYATAYAEHVLAHALGVFDHFVGFTGPEGLVDAHAFAVVYNLYANPIGATAQDLVIWPGVPR
jgi:hypothetical protein